MMFTVPFSQSGDSDAAYDDESIGAFFTAEYGLTNDDYSLLSGNYAWELIPIQDIFDCGFSYDIVDYDLKIDVYSGGTGYLIDGKSAHSAMLSDYGLTFEVEIEFTNDTDSIMEEDVKEGYSDLEAYLGVDKFSIGDKVIMKGTYRAYEYYEMKAVYGDVSSTEFVLVGDDTICKSVHRVNLDISYLPGGDVNSKKDFSLIQDYCVSGTISKEHSFGKDLSQLEVGDEYTITSTVKLDKNLFTYNIIFNGQDHFKTVLVEMGDPESTEQLEDYDFMDSSEFYIPDYLSSYGFKGLVFPYSSLSKDDLLTKAQELGVCGLTYVSLVDEGSRIYSSLVVDDDGDTNPFVFIGIGIGVGVLAIGAIVFLLLRRRA